MSPGLAFVDAVLAARTELRSHAALDRLLSARSTASAGSVSPCSLISSISQFQCFIPSSRSRSSINRSGQRTMSVSGLQSTRSSKSNKSRAACRMISRISATRLLDPLNRVLDQKTVMSAAEDRNMSCPDKNQSQQFARVGLNGIVHERAHLPGLTLRCKHTAELANDRPTVRTLQQHTTEPFMQDRVAFLHHLQDAARLFARNSKIA